MKEKVTVRNLYKVFGENPDEAIRLAKERVPKEEIFERTRSTVGVYDASFSVYEGEIFVVMGLSGSGKSTLVRLLNRLIEPTYGEILVDGENVASLSAEGLRHVRRRKMSMVFQSFALMPHMNLLDNAAFGLELSGIDRSERQQRALTALDQVGLKSYAMSYPDELSGGMQQRVGLARALANDPHILLMDEAFSALDPLIRTEMQDELVKLQQDSKRTVIFISHDLDEAMRIGDRIAIMEGGHVVQVGSPEEILNRPANEYVHSFFRGVNVASVLTVGQIANAESAAVINGQAASLESAMAALEKSGGSFGYVVDDDRVFKGVVSTKTVQSALESNNRNIADAFLADVPAVSETASIKQVIATVAKAPCAVPVVDTGSHYVGVVTKKALLQTLSREED